MNLSDLSTGVAAAQSVDPKAVVGKELALLINDGDCIGIGTGSTVDRAIRAIGDRIRDEGLTITGVATSTNSKRLAAEMGISVLDLATVQRLDFGFDGADEVQLPQCWAIKGGGGALMTEKFMAERCEQYCLIVDESKVSQRLGTNWAVPIEVASEEETRVISALLKIGASEVNARQATAIYGNAMTERGNVILDARFEVITPDTPSNIKGITGVFEHGLFLSHADQVWVGIASGQVEKHTA